MNALRARILIIDDEPVVHESCRRVLSEAGYTVDSAMGGLEALDKIKSESYDLVLSDIKMPVLDGISTLQRIKKDHPDLAVVMITGYASVDSAVDTIKLGAVDYLPKPFTPEDLLAIVANSLKQKQVREEKQRREKSAKELLKAIHSTLNLKEILDLMVTSVVRVMNAKASALSLMDRQGQHLVLVASSGLSENYLKNIDQMADGNISQLLAGKHSAVWDVSQETSNRNSQLSHQEGIASMLSVPLIVKNKVNGVLRLYTSEPREFSREEITSLYGFAEQVAIALENARTYEDLVEEFQTLREDLWEWCEYESWKYN